MGIACRMQTGVAIHTFYEKPGPNIAIRIHTIIMNIFLRDMSLLYEVPGGNLVDGLPPAASTGAGD